MPRSSFSILTYHISFLDRLLLVNANDDNVALSGVMSLGQVISSHTNNSPPPRHPPEASVTKCMVLFHHKTS